VTTHLRRRSPSLPLTLPPLCPSSQVICASFVALEVAAREVSSPSAPLSVALLLTFLGYGATTALISVSTLLLDSLGLHTAGAYRAATLDFVALVALLVGGIYVLSSQEAIAGKLVKVAAVAGKGYAATGLGPVLSALPARLPLGVAALPVPWHAALASIALVLVTVFAWTALSRTSLGLAPLFADVVARGSPRRKAVALTFNGDPSPAVTPGLLALLAQNRARATFFVSSAAAAAGGETARLIRDISAAGHEVGLLGLAGPHGTAEVVADVSAGAAALTAVLNGAGAPLPKASAPAAAPAPAPAADKNGAASPARKGRGRSGSVSSKGSAAAPATSAAAAPAAEAAPANASSASSASSASRSVVWYRPQDGSRDVRDLRAAVRSGLGVALWSACGYDWDATPEQVAARLSAQLRVGRTLPAGADFGTLDPSAVNGAVLCLHAAVPAYLQAPAAAQRPKHDPIGAAAAALGLFAGAGGVDFVTVSDLHPNRGHEPEVLPVA
jgi:peptidoglycan/xylan/chitin deacetylase (PgdA/CDA1 family)